MNPNENPVSDAAKTYRRDPNFRDSREPIEFTSFSGTPYEQDFKGATVEMYPPRIFNNASLERWGDEADERMYDRGITNYHPEDTTIDKSGRKIRQGSFFGVKPPKLDMLFASHQHIPETANVVAAAVDEANTRFGMKPIVSNDMSKFSGPAANAGIEAGIFSGVEGKPAGELFDLSNANNINLLGGAQTAHNRAAMMAHRDNVRGESPMDKAMVDLAVNSFKKQLVEGARKKRGVKPKSPSKPSEAVPKRSPQFEQLKFEGM